MCKSGIWSHCQKGNKMAVTESGSGKATLLMVDERTF